MHSNDPIVLLQNASSWHGYVVALHSFSSVIKFATIKLVKLYIE